MYIKKLILENYASIMVAMKSSKIEIDFSDRKNKICLLVGPNGSGKTSILSALTPFATLGNLDVRDNLSMIVEKEKGYKEIIICDEGHEYVIKHFYTPSGKSHTVKSYIEKDGTELNTNGNVTSFKEIVKEELDIEMDYLKLVRLGNNVTNLLDLKTTERKNYMSKLLDDVDVYLKYYKKISKDINQIKTLMNHTIDKLSKTGIRDLELAMDEKDKLEETIKRKKEELQSLSNQLAIVESKIKELGNYSELLEIRKTTSKQLEKLSKKVDSDDNSEIYQKKTEELKEKIKELEIHTSKLREKMEYYISSLDDYYNERNQLRIDIDKAKKESNVISLENIISDLEYRIRNGAPLYEKLSYSYTKEELEAFMMFLDKQNEMLETTYSFGKEIIDRVLDLKEGKVDVSAYIRSSIDDLEQEEYENACRVVLKKLKKTYGNLSGCPASLNTCKYLAFYEELTSMRKDRSDRRKEESITTLQCMDIVNTNLENIIKRFPENKALFDKMPKEVQDQFQVHKVYEKIRFLQSIYDKAYFNDLLSDITEYTNYQKMKEELIVKQEELLKEKKKSYLGYMTERLEKVEFMIDEMEKDIEAIKDTVSDNEMKTKNLQTSLDDIVELSEIISQKDTIQKTYDETIRQIQLHLSLNDKFSQMRLEYSALKEDIDKKEQIFQYMGYRITEYINLTKELEKCNSLYDEMSCVRDAWSTKEGIPLEFITLYLKDTRDITNDLLDQVYGGTIYIDEFKISEDEFQIPFVKNGKKIDDVRHASQGELSLITIALSFALTSQSLTKYNIMLLDEMDSALDTTNRINFLSIVDRQIEEIHAEQVFSISHNNTFDMYPVDIISLTGNEDVNNELANYIEIKKW